MYCDELQRTLGAENQRLSDVVEEAKLDYNDAVRSRRELQKQVEAYEKTIRQEKYYQVSSRHGTNVPTQIKLTPSEDRETIRDDIDRW